MILYYIRHGQADLEEGENNDEKKLTPLGIRQALKTGLRLSKKRFNYVLVSDCLRACETFNAMRSKLKFDEHLISRDYREAYGGLVGVPNRLMPKEVKDKVLRRKIEDRIKIDKARLNKFWKFITSLPNDARVLVIGHGNFLRMIIAKVIGINPRMTWHLRINNGAMSIFAVSPGGKPSDVVVLNDLSHLMKEEHSQNL